MKQEVRFCTAADGVRLAYAKRHWLEELGERYTVVRYDERGCGLSDSEVGDPSLETSWASPGRLGAPRPNSSRD